MTMRDCFVVMIAAMMAVGSAVAGAQNGADEKRQDGAAVAAPVGSKDRPAMVSAGVMAGLLLHKVDPVYPGDARASGVSGVVVMVATIDDQGKIAKLSVVSGPEKLRDAAVDAVNQWRYKPYLLNGNPVYVKTQITINFNIAK